MVSENSCGKSSAKTVRGFTLIELLVVIAIIAILAGIGSIATQGYVRDARLETANNKAEQVYTAIQNALIQFEINQDISPLNAFALDGGSSGSTSAKYTYLQFKMDMGNINGEDIVLKSVNGGSSKTYTYDEDDVYPYATAPTSSESADFSQFKKLAKYVTDNLSADFSGYVYACIDVDNYVVDTVFFTENVDAITIDPGTGFGNVADFADTYTKTASADGKNIVGCDDLYAQKTKYKGKDTAHLKAKGLVIGYYPMINDLTSGTYT
jgi:prepilin-type N-terminal cleavage/methylation domain-containing protein